MKKLIALLMILLAAPAFCQDFNESTNETFVNDSLVAPWYETYSNKVLNSDNSTLIAAIIGLSLAYFLGKIAFKFIKVTVIILLIILILKVIF
jgi:hypothetical protein